METPQKPTDVRLRAWGGVLKRTVGTFRENHLTDWAAALTYYAVLSIFPALVVLVSILGLAGDSATQSVLDNLDELGPGPATDIVSGAIREISSSQGTAGIALVIGLAAALWSASGYIGAFSRAANVIYEVEEGRPFWKLRPLQLAMSLFLILLVAVSAIAVVVTGPLAEKVGELFALEGTVLTVWDLAKWPVIILIVLTMLGVLYYMAPNVRQRGFRWITPGGLLGRLGLDRRLGGLRALRRQLRLLQQDLRQPRRSDRVPRLAVDLEPRRAAGCRVQRRAGARAGAGERRPGGAHARDRAAQRAQAGLSRSALASGRGSRRRPSNGGELARPHPCLL